MIRKKNRGRGGVLLLKREKFSENSSIIKKNSSRKLLVQNPGINTWYLGYTFVQLQQTNNNKKKRKKRNKTRHRFNRNRALLLITTSPIHIHYNTEVLRL